MGGKTDPSNENNLRTEDFPSSTYLAFMLAIVEVSIKCK